jgi:CRISPR-associated protein Csb1
MTIEALATIGDHEDRMYIEADLGLAQGTRFQPTGFPDLGPATYQGPDGAEMLLVESAQSMANRMESIMWDPASDDLVEPLRGLPYVRVRILQDGADWATTNSILEAHRLNSAYILAAKDNPIVDGLNAIVTRVIDVAELAAFVFRHDPNSLIHGVFFPGGIGGLERSVGARIPRMLSSFIEARGVRPVDSGGVKVDRIDPTGGERSAEEGFGHVPYHRREFTAERITGFFSIDFALLRSLRLPQEAARLLTLLAMWKIRRLLAGDLRLRTACDLTVETVRVTQPAGADLPELPDLEDAVSAAIRDCVHLFAQPPVTEVTYSAGKKKA